jgi:serine/threonine protein kinase
MKKKVGRGSTGTVYKAIRLRDSKVCAVKEVRLSDKINKLKRL